MLRNIKKYFKLSHREAKSLKNRKLFKNIRFHKRGLFVFTVVFGAIGAYVIYSSYAATYGNATPPPPSSGNQWQMTFDEEFNGTDYDHSKLTPCFDWNSGNCTSSFNNGYEHYEPGQVQVSNGVGHLIAAPLTPALSDSACYQGSCTYKSGLLSTARPNTSTSNYLYKFTYGYVEANLKPVNVQGFFTAWWMLPADPTYNYKYEIDILEQLGSDPTDMEMHYSYNNRSQSYTPNYDSQGKNGACTDMDYSQDYHRFGVDWEPTFVAFYIDGVKCGQFNGTTGGTIANTPMQLILDQMVSNDWERSVGKPLLNTSLTNELDVDYIRVYQQVPIGNNPAPTVTLTANPTTINSGQSSTLTWSSTNATSCSATTPSGWTNSTATSGNQSVSPTSTTTYTLTCTGSGGSTPASATVTVNTSAVTGDLNSDGHVNIFDLSIFLTHWQQTGTGIPEDFNNDSIVNIFDLSILLSNYGV